MVSSLCAAGGRRYGGRGLCLHTARGGRGSGDPCSKRWAMCTVGIGGWQGLVRGWVAVSQSGVVGSGPALSMVANVRCCRAIVRVMSIWLWGSGT